jgi:hypothetical protein
MTQQIEGWRLTTTANVTDGTKTTLGWAIRVADEVKARDVISKALGGITELYAEPLSGEDIANYGLAQGKWKQL